MVTNSPTANVIGAAVAPFKILMLLPNILFPLGNLICGIIIATGVRNGCGRNQLSCAAGFNICLSVFSIIDAIGFMGVGLLLLGSSSLLGGAIEFAVSSSPQASSAVGCSGTITDFVSTVGGWMLTTGFLCLFLAITSIGASSAANHHKKEGASRLIEERYRRPPSASGGSPTVSVVGTPVGSKGETELESAKGSAGYEAGQSNV